MSDIDDKPQSDASGTTAVLTMIPVKLSANTAKTRRLNRKNQMKFLEYMLSDYNVTRAAAHIGVSRRAIEMKLANDANFKTALDQVKDAHLDMAEQAMFAVASVPSREGFNDRKLALQSHRPETYAPRSDIRIDHRVTINNALPELRRLLHGATPKRIPHDDVTDSD